MTTAIPSQAPTSIDRRAHLTPRDFSREYLYPQRPVILLDMISSWPALSRWTPAALRARFADREVVIKDVTYRFGEFIDQLVKADPLNPAPYLSQFVISKTFPELVEDMRPLPLFLTPNWLPGKYPIRFIDQWFNRACEFDWFIGAKGDGLYLLHYDHLHFNAFSIQISGTKRFYLYPPEQTHLLYATRNISAINDVLKPDLARFPLFAEAKPLVFDLHAGEMLFIPPGWWHDTRMLTDSISVSTNTACASNWAAVRTDVWSDLRPRIRYLAWLYLWGLGLLRRWQRPAT